MQEIIDKYTECIDTATIFEIICILVAVLSYLYILQIFDFKGVIPSRVEVKKKDKSYP